MNKTSHRVDPEIALPIAMPDRVPTRENPGG